MSPLIVKKNGIMLVDFAITGERDRGLPPIAAIREAYLLHCRPIMMHGGGDVHRRAAGARHRLGAATGSR